MTLEVIARAKIRPGQLEGFKAQAFEIVRVTAEQDTRTLRCDWFLDEHGAECEVHEIFVDERGLIEHQIRAFVGTPLIKDGQWIATFCVQSEEPREWTRDQVALIEVTAQRVWGLGERARIAAKMMPSIESLAMMISLSVGG